MIVGTYRFVVYPFGMYGFFLVFEGGYILFSLLVKWYVVVFGLFFEELHTI